jgi:hypothetical protein
VHVAQKRRIVDTEGEQWRFLCSPLTGKGVHLYDGMTDPLQAYASCQLCGLSFNREGMNTCRLCLKVHSNPTTVLEVLDNKNGCDLELLDA